MIISDILKQADDTVRERDKVYGDSIRIHAVVLNALFPKGLPATASMADWARVELINIIVGKLVRYCVAWCAGLGGHHDSIHDMGVYCFLLEKMDGEEKQ